MSVWNIRFGPYLTAVEEMTGFVAALMGMGYTLWWLQATAVDNQNAWPRLHPNRD